MNGKEKNINFKKLNLKCGRMDIFSPQAETLTENTNINVIKVPIHF